MWPLLIKIFPTLWEYFYLKPCNTDILGSSATMQLSWAAAVFGEGASGQEQAWHADPPHHYHHSPPSPVHLCPLIQSGNQWAKSISHAQRRHRVTAREERRFELGVKRNVQTIRHQQIHTRPLHIVLIYLASFKTLKLTQLPQRSYCSVCFGAMSRMYLTWIHSQDFFSHKQNDQRW